MTVTTTGDEADPNGYVLGVGTQERDVGTNGSVSFSGLSVGAQEVELTDLASNCSVSAANPRSVDVVAEATVTTAFNITCAATTGSIEVTISTSGDALDPDGYTARVDNDAEQSVGINGEARFNGVPAGDHTLELTGVASNCTVGGSNPRIVTVAAGGTASTSLTVSCVEPTGSVEVNAVTTGDDIDPNGYSVLVGVTEQPMSVNGTISFDGLSTGDYSVELKEVASNCQVAGENPRTVTVAADATTVTTFQLSCLPVLSGKIAFDSRRSGTREIYVMNVDGSNAVNLTNGAGSDEDPSVSPNGTKIAFESSGRVYVMNADGSNRVELANPGDSPSWSPDGTRIAFRSARDGDSEIYVMNVDGTGQVNLTNNSVNDFYPTWSPDGTRIAFTSQRDGNQEIYVMNADGSNQVNLTNNPAEDSYPAWSPAGSLIAFSSSRDCCNTALFVMAPDGSSVQNVTEATVGALDWHPAWSPDGARIAVTAIRDGSDFEVFVMDADGSNQVNITNDPDTDQHPSWSP